MATNAAQQATAGPGAGAKQAAKMAIEHSATVDKVNLNTGLRTWFSCTFELKGSELVVRDLMSK